MDDRGEAWGRLARGGAIGRLARGWSIALLATATVTLAVAIATTAGAAGPFIVPISVEAKLVRLRVGPVGAVVTGRVVWNAAAVAAHHMSVGDLRLVAVSEHGHRPTLLATERYEGIAREPSQLVTMFVKRKDLHVIRPGNRVVLTASQHSVLSVGTRTERTYVTVGELQPFGTPQDRIGRRDCSFVPIEAGVQLNDCDLVGAFLDRALVSRRVKPTRMMLADLTGATMRKALLAGLNVAGGRLNLADASGATINNMSMAGAEATGLIARDADSPHGEDGANLFDARLTDADFRGAKLFGVTLEHARLDGSDFRGATWSGGATGRAVTAVTASFRGADLEGLKGTGGNVYFADFTGANLHGAPFSMKDLEWATLCRTGMPDGFPPGAGYRDCRTPSDAGPVPAPNAYVKVTDARLDRLPGGTVISAVIQWGEIGSFRLSNGDIRVVAVDGSTGLPTTVGTLSIRGVPSTPTRYAFPINRNQVAALNPGNRVVLTATQHPPISSDPTRRTTQSYVTVRTVQPGPGRGRVGSRDCSEMALTAPAPPVPPPPAPQGYEFCDLPGAVLKQAELSGPMRAADLTGADLSGAALSKIVFDGAAMGGVVATGAEFDGVHMVDSFAPGLTMPETTISDGRLRAKSLDNANFEGATLRDTSFETARLRSANFHGATLNHDTFAFAGLQRAKLDHSPHRPHATTLFLANLTRATLAGPNWGDDEFDERPWMWATLCETRMPDGATISGDRDCPR